MVTTRRAEGFFPPTTKGKEPLPASVSPDADFMCHNEGVGLQCGGGFLSVKTHIRCFSYSFRNIETQAEQSSVWVSGP